MDDFKVLILVLLTNVLVGVHCWGQNQSASLNSFDAEEPAVAGIYPDHGVGNILSGRVYQVNYPGIEGNQYYTGEYLRTGDLMYDGILFKGISIQYDIYKQLIVVKPSKKAAKMVVLDNQKVSYFAFDGNEFINYEDSVLNRGIYQNVFKGKKSKLLVKREKERGSGGISITSPYSFDSWNWYYLVRDKGSYSLSGKKDLLAAFDNDQQLKSFIRNNNLKFSPTRIEESLLKALAFYESL